MAAQANIVIADGQASPANKTFVPKGSLRTPAGTVVSEWREQSATNAEGFFLIREIFHPKNSNGVEKYRYEIYVPTLETVATNDAGITPAPKVAYQQVFKCEYWVSARASQQELKDIAAYAKNLLALTMVTDAIKNREHAW